VNNAIVEMKRRIPRFGCPRIAQQINLSFGLDLDKDTVQCVLAVHYKSDPGNRGPSWLTIIGPASRLLKSHWVMVGMALL
jgi:putative transposase